MFTNADDRGNVEGWVNVYSTSTLYDAELIHSYLLDREIENQILSRKDSAINVSFGDLAVVNVYVPAEEEEKARKALQEWDDATPQGDSEDGAPEE